MAETTTIVQEAINQQQFCTFFLDQLLFGIEVTAVQEIVRYQNMTMVPLAPSEVGGLINLRGQIVTAIDLRLRLALPPRLTDQFPINIVAHTNGETVSLLVDEIGDVLQVSEEDFEPPPETLTGNVRQLIKGAYKLEKGLLLILDVDKAVDIMAVG